MTTKRTLLLSLALVILMAGCGERKMQLGGTVTFSDDGAPVTSGFVIFTAVGADFQSRSVIEEDGTYTLSFTGNNDGIPPGEYAVSLVGVEKHLVVPHMFLWQNCQDRQNKIRVRRSLFHNLGNSGKMGNFSFLFG